jgi:hypothetical protein
MSTLKNILDGLHFEELKTSYFESLDLEKDTEDFKIYSKLFINNLIKFQNTEIENSKKIQELETTIKFLQNNIDNWHKNYNIDKSEISYLKEKIKMYENLTIPKNPIIKEKLEEETFYKKLIRIIKKII